MDIREGAEQELLSALLYLCFGNLLNFTFMAC